MGTSILRTQLKQMCSRSGEEREMSLNTNTEHQPYEDPPTKHSQPGQDSLQRAPAWAHTPEATELTHTLPLQAHFSYSWFIPFLYRLTFMKA